MCPCVVANPAGSPGLLQIPASRGPRPAARSITGRRLLPAVALLALLAAPSLARKPVDAVPAASVAGASASVFLEDLTWTELRDAVRAGQTTVLIPVGGTEQSGPALSLGKHNVRARLLAGRIAQDLGNAIVAPVLPYVPEGSVVPPSSHMRFAGTISVPESTFEQTLAAIAASLRAHGFRDIVLLGDHGGYQRSLARVAERLNREWGRDAARVYALPEYYRAATQDYAALLRSQGYPDSEIGTHAALADTALQLALAPQTVRTQVLASAPVLDASVGIYGGSPRRASAALGAAGVDTIVVRSVEAIRAAISAAHAPAAKPH